MSDSPRSAHRWRALVAPAAACLAALALVPAVGAQDPAGPAPPPPTPTPAPEPEPAEEPKPSLRRAAVIERVTGTVRWRPERGSYRSLAHRTRVALGAVVDARRGRVRVIVSRGGGRTWRAVFFGGRFRITQSEPGSELVTTLVLAGGSFRDTCGTTAATARTDARASVRRRRVRRLWGNGKGRFRTRGRYSAATVRGTKWLVEDRCDGTLTRVARGEVEVEDFTQPDAGPEGMGGGGAQDPATAPAPQRTSARTVRVGKGDAYVARPRG